MRTTVLLKAGATLGLLVACPTAFAQVGQPGPVGPDAGVAPTAPIAPIAPDAGVPADAGVPTDPSAPTVPEAPVEAAPASAPDAASQPAREPEEPIDLEPGADLQTGIRGRIGGGPDGKPLPLAPVLIEGDDGRRTAISDESGAYKIHVRPGRYTLRSYYDMFHGARIDNVRVRRGAFLDVNFVLDPIDAEKEIAVEELEIPYRADTTSAAAQDQLRQESAGIGEGMGAQQMSKSGAGDAESAARRVVGVTIDDSQLVIRGLGGRYTRVLVNGDPVPSTDPDRPGVDLDLFPTSVIDSLTIHKVFLPNLPGDFAGGVLDLSVVRYPRDFMFEAGVSGGFNSNTTFRKRPDYRGGSYDWLGFDDGTRALPDSVPDDTALFYNRSTRTPGGIQDPDEVEAIAEDFENIWEIRPTRAAPNVGLNSTVGDSFDLSRSTRFGYMATAAYSHEEKRQTGTFAKPNAAGDPVRRGDLEQGSAEVSWTALTTAGLDLGVDHSLTLMSMLVRSMEDGAQYKDGFDLSGGGAYEEWLLAFVTRTLWFNQLQGDHRNLGGERLRLRWSAFYGLGERDEPDRRTITYARREPLYRWDYKAGSGERFFSDLQQTDVGGRASLRIPLWEEGWGTVGGATRHTQRDFGLRRFLMEPASVSDQTVLTAGPEELFSEEGIGTITQIDENTLDNEAYEAKQLLFAGFAELETPIVGPLSVAGGLRIESFKQQLTPVNPFEATQRTRDPDEEDDIGEVDRTDTDFLPGAALKYALTEQMFVRAAYAYTLGRAQMRELASYQYYDFLRSRLVSGNPDLDQTKIHNVDLRWEWFFDEAQVVAVSGFYKRFLDPIELQILNPQTQDSKYLNAKAARNFGAEIELRINLGHLQDWLENFDFETNLSIVHSRVEIPPEGMGTVRAERRMFGQAPYALNVGLHYFEPKARIRSGLVYNVVGPRITDVGVRTGDMILPDIVEQPFHSVDLVNSWNMTDHFKLKLKLRNILFQQRSSKQGDLVVDERNPGASASIGLEYEH